MRLAIPRSWRDRLAVLMALVTVVGLGTAFMFSKDTHFLMPGPLASVHGSIEKCSSCHTKSGSGKLSWVHGLVAGDRQADSKACLTCHKMPDTAFNAHSASADVLMQSTKRLTKIAATTLAPQSARVQSALFPARDVVASGLYCATCHQEHQGVNFKLNKISNEQCRSCHVLQFDSFDRHHPKFENYPFKRRTRIVYDHAGHFGKHYPELLKKDPTRRIPETCSTCHNSQNDKRVMAVAPFEQTCTGCHLNQITGKERPSGPKGIAFLSVPGLDLQTLKRKNAAIGEWPDASDAALTPFMKVMISRDERGRALIKTVDGLNLQDLANANDDQIKAVTDLAWEIKRLFHTLLAGRASDALGDLNISGGAKLSAQLVADLTASIPRDVVSSAQQQWLPNLAAEMATRPATGNPKQSNSNAVDTESRSTASRETPPAGPDSREPTKQTSQSSSDDGPAGKTSTSNVKRDGEKGTRPANGLPPAMRAGVGDPDRIAQAEPDGGEETPSSDEHGATGRATLPSGTPRSIEARRKGKATTEEATDKPSSADNKGDAAKDQGPADGKSKADEGGAHNAGKAAPDAPSAKADAANSTATTGGKQPPADPADQSDDLLFPTPDELRGIKAVAKDAEKPASKTDNPAGKDDTGSAKADAAKADPNSSAGSSAASDTSATTTQVKATPVISIGSDVDPESWAEYGGWYQQDFAIFYRPTGHKDKFVYSWLFLTGPQAPKGERSAAASVFALLTDKDAQGSCTKCHSIDDIQGKGRLVNFSPPTARSKQGRFTNFIHEPHFGIMENRGCLTCHSLEKERPYLKSYEQGNPQSFASNFGEVKKETCKTCHTSNMARQDCLLCHSYHVGGVATPIMNTKIPVQ